MFDVELSTVLDTPPCFNNLTNKELIAAVAHYHSKLPALLQMMVNRFEALAMLSEHSGNSVHPCPSCGTKLQVKVTPVS